MKQSCQIALPILLFALGATDIYLIYDNVLSLIRFENHKIVIRNYDYELITLKSAIFFTIYSFLFLMSLVGIFFKRYWAFLLINILALPVICTLGIGITKSFIEKDLVDIVYIIVFLLLLLLLVVLIYSRKNFTNAARIKRNKNPYLIISVGVLVLIAFLYLLVIKT